MRKFAMCFIGAIMVLSLAACAPTQVKQETVGIPAGYQPSTGGASDKVPDPNVEPMDVISVYTPNSDATGLTQAMDAVEKLDAQSLVDKLVEYGVLEEGTKALSFDVKNKIGTLNLSKVPASSGTAGEKLMLAAVGNTFTENFELDKLKLLVNGKNYSSGHIKQKDGDYLEYIRDYKKM